MKHLNMKFVAALMIALIAMVGQSFAQSATTGGITGRVMDPQGAVVANATVKITNLGTQAETTLTSNDEGAYRFSNLQPGTYRVDVTAGSFAPAFAEKVTVEVGRETAVDIPLTIGGQAANVTVTAEAPVINTTDMANATNITQTEIQDLPINGRRASDFARLTPGVNPEGDFGLNSFRGLSSLLNNHTLDGTDNNNTFFSEERGRTRIQYSVSQAAVREFQVNNTNFSAEYGRAAGGVINTVTKSGTNDLRGELFFFDRNNKWGARNPSALLPTATGLVAVKPKDTRYQFGGAVGGRIIKDKLFFFFNYDQQKREFPGVGTPNIATAFNTITVSTPASCTTLPNAVTNPGAYLGCRGINQTQTDAGLTFLRSLTGEAPRRQDQRIIFPKIDWNINGRNALSVSYNSVRTTGLNSFQTPSVVNVGREDFGDDFVSIDTLNSRLTTTFSPTIVNEFRFQWGHENARSILQTETAEEAALAAKGNGINGLLPSVSFGTSANVGFQFGTSTNFQRAKFPDEHTLQFYDIVTDIVGNHGLKFGFDIKYTKDDISNLRTEYGSYSYNSVADFIRDYTYAITPTGTAPKAYNNFTQSFGLRDYTLKTPDYAFFFQDDWHATHRLTLNMGLRYEYQSFPAPQFPNNLNPTLAAATATVPQRYTQDEANAIIARTGSFPKDKNNFGPRFGFAWDIFGDNKTVLRGGYGLYFGRVPNTFLSSAVTNTGGVGSQLSALSLSPSATTPSFPNVFDPNNPPARGSANLSITTISPQFENPEVHEIDIVFEREIAKNTALSVSYLFAGAHKLPTFVDLNLPYPTGNRTYTISGGPLDGTVYNVPLFVGARPFTNYNQVIDMESLSKSEYNGLVIQVQRRMTGGLAFQSSYTYSSAIDYGQQFGTFAPSFMNISNPFDLSYDRGPSGNDVPHKFVASAVWRPSDFFHMEKSGWDYKILRDFQLSPIVVISSGYALNASIPSVTSGTISNTLFGGGGSLVLPIARNKYHRPSTWTADLRVSKRIYFGEHKNLELLAEGFNIFNHSNVTAANTSFISNQNTTTNVLTYNSSFGSTTSINNTIIFSPRQIQLGVRFNF